MNIEEIARLAREAGARGESYGDFTSRDDVTDAAGALDEQDGLDTAKIEAAYREGRREHRAANGWVFAWTTAPESYDQFGTETVETHVWGTKMLRRVIMEPSFAPRQADRYWSGSYAAWDEDPRVTEARIRDQIARENAEREEARARRESGLAWIRDVADDVLSGDEDALDVMLHDRGLTWKDARDERRRRADEQKAREQAEEWARCRATFEDGATLVDDGAHARRTNLGLIPARDAEIWRGVRIDPHYEHRGDAWLADVIDQDERVVGSFARVAERLGRGELRIAAPGEHLPTLAVMKRFDGSMLNEIVRVEAEGRVAWVGRERFAYDLKVLDEQGRLVRKRSILEAAEKAWREQERARYEAIRKQGDDKS